jgi:hypothetical protein
MIAAVASTLALGSAAAYAITLPIQLPGLSLNVPIDLPSPLVSPPDTHLPDNPIVGTPSEDEMAALEDELKDAFGPDGAGRDQGPAPAKRSAPAPQKAPAKEKADAAAKDLKSSLESLKGARDETHEDLDDLKDILDDEDWAEWAKDLEDGGISLKLGEGINVCNNNNVEIVVNRGSDDRETTVEQRNSSNDVVTIVNGERTDHSGGPTISCDH